MSQNSLPKRKVLALLGNNSLRLIYGKPPSSTHKASSNLREALLWDQICSISHIRRSWVRIPDLEFTSMAFPQTVTVPCTLLIHRNTGETHMSPGEAHVWNPNRKHWSCLGNPSQNTRKTHNFVDFLSRKTSKHLGKPMWNFFFKKFLETLGPISLAKILLYLNPPRN